MSKAEMQRYKSLLQECAAYYICITKIYSSPAK